MIYKIKKFVRDNENLMFILSKIYRLLFHNRIKGRAGLNYQAKGAFLKKTQIINHGKNNRLVIGKGCRLSNCRFEFFGDNNQVLIDHDCRGRTLDIWIADGSNIEIKNHSHFVGDIHIASIEGKTVHIGERCLFSSEIVLRTSDSHSIMDMKNNRINPAEDVWIDDHVWVGQQVMILKGAKIGRESIIGTRALVTGKSFPSNVVLAGSPAKVIKEEVCWHHELR